MANKDWKTKRSKNPYVPYSWINTKEGLLLEIHYDVGFGEQRNVTIYNYRNQKLSGFEEIKTFYCENTKEAKEKAMEYMRKN
jgi:hypothetical protein